MGDKKKFEVEEVFYPLCLSTKMLKVIKNF